MSGDPPNSAIIGSLNADGRPDLVVAKATEFVISVFLNITIGTNW